MKRGRERGKIMSAGYVQGANIFKGLLLSGY